MKWYLKCIRQYADFSGRARRKEYWLFQLFNSLIYLPLSLILVFGILDSIESIDSYNSNNASFKLLLDSGIWGIPLILYYLFIFIPSLAVSVRRFHDIGKSGWWYFIVLVTSFIPHISFVTSIIAIVACCLDSQPGRNQWGPNPKEIDFTDTNGNAEQEFSEWDTESEEEAKL